MENGSGLVTFGRERRRVVVRWTCWGAGDGDHRLHRVDTEQIAVDKTGTSGADAFDLEDIGAVSQRCRAAKNSGSAAGRGRPERRGRAAIRERISSSQRCKRALELGGRV